MQPIEMPDRRDVQPNQRHHRFLGDGGIKVSFEFPAPGTARSEKRIWQSLKRLEPLKPTSVGITYGAESFEREQTHAIIARILNETELDVAAHLTCVAATRAEVDTIARKYWQLGVRRIVALRGNPRQGESYQAHPAGYANSVALVGGLRALAPFEIAVSAYPEKHPESPTIDHDLDLLKAKIDVGATTAITQYFFDNDVFFRFRDRASAKGIKIPIIPGILPIYNFRQIARFAFYAHVSIPRWLIPQVEGLNNDSETRGIVAAATAAQQILDLMEHGVQHVHFYTFNHADLVYAICHMLGLRGIDSSR